MLIAFLSFISIVTATLVVSAHAQDRTTIVADTDTAACDTVSRAANVVSNISNLPPDPYFPGDNGSWTPALTAKEKADDEAAIKSGHCLKFKAGSKEQQIGAAADLQDWGQAGRDNLIELQNPHGSGVLYGIAAYWRGVRLKPKQPAPAPSHWWVYNTLAGSCDPAREPPSPAYLVEFDRAGGLEDQIEDRGNEVDVEEPQGNDMVSIYRFFRTEDACAAYIAAQAHSLDKYR